MDLFVEKKNLEVRMSTLGVLIQDIKVSNAVVEANRQTINGKNGKLFMGAKHTEKKISVIGKYYVADAMQDELMKDRLNGIFADTQPFFMTKMFNTRPLYNFERPGQESGFDVFKMDEQRKYKYRYSVLLDGDIDYNFQGYSERGLLYEVSFTLCTADIPYGVTTPKTIDLGTKSSGFIEYQGTADCSQLEWPWSVKVTFQKGGNLGFSLRIGERTLTYKNTSSIAYGDIFLLSGSSFTLNGANINNKTNIEYFVLEPSINGYIPYSIDASSASIELINKVDFYK